MHKESTLACKCERGRVASLPSFHHGEKIPPIIGSVFVQLVEAFLG